MPDGLLDPVTSRADKNGHARRLDPAAQTNQETG